MDTSFQTVVETKTFIRLSGDVMSEEECSELIEMIAANPECGTSLGGGLYKVRFGRRGAYRVVYLFAGIDIPVFLLAAFAKADQANLTRKELEMLIKVAKQIAAEYREME
jgi:hypothetical protein